MTYFDVERYELHTSTVRIKAKSKAEAIARVLKGEGTEIEGSQAYVEPADMYGTTVGDHFTEEEVDELIEVGVVALNDVDTLDVQIDTIRDIAESADQTDDEE